MDGGACERHWFEADRGVVESLGTGTLKYEVGIGKGTAQESNGGAALAYADGVLELRIVDSVVSIPINGQVREHVQTPSAQTTEL